MPPRDEVLRIGRAMLARIERSVPLQVENSDGSAIRRISAEGHANAH
jgi:hypothetical protein